MVTHPCPHRVPSALGFLCLEVQAPSGPEYSEMCLRMQRFQRFHKRAERGADRFVSPDKQSPLGLLVVKLYRNRPAVDVCMSRGQGQNWPTPSTP